MNKEMKKIRDLKEMISLVARLDFLLRKAFSGKDEQSEPKKVA